MYPELYLKKNEEHRLQQGHPWVYSNEVDVHKTPLKNVQAGDLVQVLSHSGLFLGVGYVNPNTLLSVRVLTREAHQKIDLEFFKQKVRAALALRDSLFSRPYYRLIYGEGDDLPGVVVDRYGQVLVVQITTAGMEALKEMLLEALKQELSPATVVWRNDSSMRTLENLDSYVSIAWGEAPEFIELEENGVQFQAPVLSGQKTAWFYDHRDNRARLHSYVKGKRILDVFSYLGAWGIQALKQGAKEVVSIDSSAAAIEQQCRNAELNGVEDRLTLRCEDAFEALKDLQKTGEYFDVVVIDPPAFIKRRKDSKAGMKAYFHLNKLALGLLKSPGILVSASCSQHLSEESLLQIIRSVGFQQHYALRLLARGRSSWDHPMHLALPEMDYLKALFIVKSE